MSQLKNQDNQPANNNSLISAQWQGPLPPPSTLAEFNAIIPNGAERIMRMAEIEQEGRIKFDSDNLRNDGLAVRRGQYLSFVIVMASLAAATYTAYIGAHWAVSCALVGVPILNTVKAIVKK